MHVALIHHPVLNKRGETIAAAVTTVDLHDFARLVKTYGADSFSVVTPLADQQALAERVRSHWTRGYGACYNPARKAAIDPMEIRDSVEAVAGAVENRTGVRPVTVVTSAREPGERNPEKRLGFSTLRNCLFDATPYLLCFGTAWGLTDAFMETADYQLAPVAGREGYNHLSVRTAAAVILDRLLGPDGV